MCKAWIGVDLDGTLAIYTYWEGPYKIGAPIPKMVARVKELLAQGQTIKIFTARVSSSLGDTTKVREAIENWCLEHIGQKLEVTAEKDFMMLEMYDDRCIQVEPNTGRLVVPPMDE